jgi:hypothetical protein
LFNANSAIYQLYHGENKVTFNVKKINSDSLYAFKENIYEMNILSETRGRAYERGIPVSASTRGPESQESAFESLILSHRLLFIYFSFVGVIFNYF